MNRIKKIMEIEHFKELTPIQKAVVERSNPNRDLIGISSTGSGKSHAFFMSIFNKIDLESDEVQAVIFAPTRELAYQLYERCKKISDAFNVKVKLITGGMERTTANIQAQIVIGTPGRMKDLFIEENVLRLDTAKIMIIDETDMTLEFGFLEDIDMILSHMDKKIQLMVFSATVPQGLQPFLKKYLYNPEIIQISTDEDYQSDVQHILISCKHKSYKERLLDVLPCINPYVCLIFANTTKEASEIATFLREHNYQLVELHGGLESRERYKAIKEIQSQKKSYIVASDVASRGIDLEGITHVISCGFPKDLNFYVHRAGRTGRVDRDGVCIALYQEKDQSAIKSLEKKGIHFESKDIRNHQIVDVKPKKQTKKEDPFEQDIKKIKNKKTKVKPDYKKRQNEEIERMKKKKRREMIKNDIKRQKKERAIQKQKEKQ
ncbi:DEAD/DEAH box helicase [Floccifex sp.]|uniref:DEAD/DEAH box helicase n=1 Tax=Floccifex sp. TaxID=2815810 RepID=UPI003F1123C3